MAIQDALTKLQADITALGSDLAILTTDMATLIAAINATQPATVAVSLAASSTSVNAASPVTLTATVTGSSNTSVVWSVDGVAAGDAAVGVISGTGDVVVYNAPTTTGTHTVTATSAADPTKTATVTLSVTALSPNLIVAISPNNPMAVGSGGTVQFQATANMLPDTAVTWQVDGITGGNATVGTITQAGLYTAPTVTSQAIHTISAISQASPNSQANLRVCIAIHNTVVTASGPNGSDDTSALNASLSAAGSGICHVSTPGVYHINPMAVDGKFGLSLNAGNTLLMDPGVILQCLTQSGTGNYAMIGCEANNTAVVGGEVIGDRAARNLPTFIDGSGTDLEVGMGIEFADASGYIALGTNYHDHCCDGIFITNKAANGTISDCVCNNNRRNGLSVTDGTNWTIQYSSFTNSNGNDPQCGIDMEPNSGCTVSGIQILHCSVSGNSGGGVAGGGSVANGISGNNTAICSNCSVIGCTVTNNGSGGYKLPGIAWDESTGCTISSNTVQNNPSGGIRVWSSFLKGTVTKNTVSGNGGVGLAVGEGTLNDCSGTAVSANTVTGNTSGQQVVQANSGALVS
jgi:parallel beta-helix repeat protein